MTCPFQFYKAESNHNEIIEWLTKNYKFQFFNEKSSVAWLWREFDEPIFAMDSDEDGYCRVINQNARWEIFDGMVYIKDLDDALIFRLKMGCDG